MKKILIIIVGFYIGLILFLPKENLFFTLQDFLKKENIYINSKTEETILNLDLKNNTIFVNKMDLIKIQNVEIMPLFFYNQIVFYDLVISGLNFESKHLKIYYSILHPIKIFIKGDKINGEVNLIDRNLKIYFEHPSKNIKSFLKKDEKGYYYAQKF